MTNPVPDAEIEAVAKAICGERFLDSGTGDDGWAGAEEELREQYRAEARAAIAVLTPMIEADVAERCAAIARDYGDTDSDMWNGACKTVADAIRSAFPLPSPVGGETK